MDTVEVMVVELNGSALDWAVAKASDTEIDDSRGKELRINVLCAGLQSPWVPTQNWHQCGPMIDKLLKTGQWEIVQGIHTGEVMIQNYNSECLPVDGKSYEMQSMYFMSESIKVAACQAIVYARLGETVSIPSELMQ